jgi:hypothetical protein
MLFFLVLPDPAPLPAIPAQFPSAQRRRTCQSGLAFSLLFDPSFIAALPLRKSK